MLYTITIPINVSGTTDPSPILDIAIEAAEVMVTDIEDMLGTYAKVNQELGGAMVMDHQDNQGATSMNVVLS